MALQLNGESGSPENEYIANTYRNVQSNLIQITEDKLENKLNKYIPYIKKSNDWYSWLTLAVSILLVLVTSDFHAFMQIPADIWYHIFVIVCVLAWGFTIYSIFCAIKCTKSATIEKIIDDIKGKC